MRLSPGQGKRQQRPFIAQSKLRLQGSFKARIQISTAAAGKLSLAWRLQGQKGFVGSQLASTAVHASSEFQDVEIPVDTTGTVIHVRVLLPAGRSAIRRIDLLGSQDRVLRTWRFDEANPGKAKKSEARGKVRKKSRAPKVPGKPRKPSIERGVA